LSLQAEGRAISLFANVKTGIAASLHSSQCQQGIGLRLNNAHLLFRCLNNHLINDPQSGIPEIAGLIHGKIV
jgi:hypothetical protein